MIRYGDEIGMGDDLKLPERNCARTPMQWSTEPHAGFTKSDKPIMPVISSGPYGFDHVNVAAQRRDPNSLLDWMERIIRMRKEVPEIGWGDFSFISAQATEVLIMRYEWRNNSVLLRSQSKLLTSRGELSRDHRPAGSMFADQSTFRQSQSTDRWG